MYFNTQEKIGERAESARRLQQGEDRAAPRDRDGVPASTTRSASSARARRSRRNIRSRPASPATTRITRAASGTIRATANALLDRFGYKKGADGYRNLPDGKPLVVRYSSIPIERDRQFDELLQRSLDAIGMRVEIRKERFAELIKLGQAMPADDAQQRVDRRLSGRRQLHAAPVRAEHRAEQQRVLPVAGIRPPVREIEAAARRPGAQQALSRHDAPDGSAYASGSSRTAAIATCCCSPTCSATRSTRSCMPSGCISIVETRSAAKRAN